MNLKLQALVVKIAYWLTDAIYYENPIQWLQWEWFEEAPGVRKHADRRVKAAVVKTWSKKVEIELFGFMSRITDVSSDPVFALSAEA